MNFIQLKTKKLSMYPCGCHGYLATIATTYVADSFCLKTKMLNMNSTGLNMKELQRYRFGCHCNHVTIATRYVANSRELAPIVPKKIHCQYELKMTHDKRVLRYNVFSYYF